MLASGGSAGMSSMSVAFSVGSSSSVSLQSSVDEDFLLEFLRKG